MTFYSNSGYYLDLFMEGDEASVTDIYVCSVLHNFTNLEKLYDFGPCFYVDKEVLFKPDKQYLLIEEQYNIMRQEVELLKPNIMLEEFITWYDGYRYIRNFIADLDPFTDLDYKIYSKAHKLLSDFNTIEAFKKKAQHAIDALIDFQKATTEREKLIWFFENRNDLYKSYNYILPVDLRHDSIVFYKSNNLELPINISGYEYVMNYFRKLDATYNTLMEKYKPFPEHYAQSLTNSVQVSLENYLRLHNVHFDVVEEYGRKNS